MTVTMTEMGRSDISVKYRWDVLLGESVKQLAERYERDLRRRRDGELDMRFKEARWLVTYRKNGCALSEVFG